MSHPVTRPKRKAANPEVIVSLDAALDLFLLDRKVKRASPATLSFYSRQVKSFIAECSSQFVHDLGEVTAGQIREHLVRLQERGLKDRSVHAAARSLRAGFNFAVDEEPIAVSPMDRVGMPKVDRRILPAFKADEIKRLLDSCISKRDAGILLCLLDTGCRASEFVAINGADVDLAYGIVHIRNGKGRKGRVAFLGNEALRAGVNLVQTILHGRVRPVRIA
jgi:site-specific recombinase XerC